MLSVLGVVKVVKMVTVVKVVRPASVLGLERPVDAHRTRAAWIGSSRSRVRRPALGPEPGRRGRARAGASR